MPQLERQSCSQNLAVPTRTSPPEQRSSLADLLRSRNDLARKVLTVNELKIKVLDHPSPEAEALLRQKIKEVAADRALVTEKLRVFLPQTVNVDGLKSMLPMLAAVLAQYVNVPLLLDAFGVEPDVIETSVSSLKNYFKSGLD